MKNNEVKSIRKFDNIPYAKRQFVLVLDDKVIEAENIAKERAKKEGQKSNWKFIGQVTLALLGIAAGPPGILVTLPAAAALIIKDVVDSVTFIRTHGIDILTVSRTEAKSLIFPPGHPLNNVIYAGHPTNSKIYYSLADFHMRVFEHKFIEAINLLIGLGATMVNVESVEGYTREDTRSINLSIPVGSIETGVQYDKDRSKLQQAIYTATLEPKEDIILPDNMVWHSHEPTWRQIAEARQFSGLKEFSLKLDYNDDFGVNAKLFAKVSETGLDIGGRIKDYQSTNWKLEGKFSETGKMYRCKWKSETGERCKNLTSHPGRYCILHREHFNKEEIFDGSLKKKVKRTSKRIHIIQCSATSKKGKRCKRKTYNPSGKCWQHEL